MKVIEKGHLYELEHVEGEGKERLQFIMRSGGGLVHPKEVAGTNTQEVLRVIIDRTEYLHAIIPCEENLIALKALREALFQYEARAYRRKDQMVNGTGSDHHRTPVPLSTRAIELQPHDTIDGHIRY